MKSQTLSAQLTVPVFKTWTYQVTVSCNIVCDCKIKALYKAIFCSSIFIIGKYFYKIYIGNEYGPESMIKLASILKCFFS